jgi:hypothetical protein
VIVYHNQSNQAEAKFARELHERVRREFPEVISILDLSCRWLTQAIRVATHLQILGPCSR